MDGPEKRGMAGTRCRPDSYIMPYLGERRRPQRRGRVGNFIDSFKRDPNAHVTPKGVMGADGKEFDADGAAAATPESPLGLLASSTPRRLAMC